MLSGRSEQGRVVALALVLASCSDTRRQGAELGIEDGSDARRVDALSDGGRPDAGGPARDAAPNPLAMVTAQLAPAVVGVPYVAKLEATGGRGAYQWSLTSGTLPAGLKLVPAGWIEGAPPLGGKATFTLQVSDALRTSVSRSFTLEARLWQSFLRKGHPRLFFDAQTWPAVRQRATGVMQPFYAEVKKHAETTPPEYNAEVTEKFTKPQAARDWGKQLMSMALVYRVDPTPERLSLIKQRLKDSLAYYNASVTAGWAVDWYSISRIGWLAALDWVWDELSPAERQALGKSMLQHLCAVLSPKSPPLCGTTVKPTMTRRNIAGHDTGYYGDDNLAWFAGLLFHKEGIDDAAAEALLQEGYSTYQKLFAWRAELSGKAGGAASSTVTYSFQHYSWAEWNFFHTWRSATGQDFSRFWPYLTRFPHYILWNWLPGDLEYGYGDTPHIDNKFPKAYLYTHLSHLMHFYGRWYPEEMALAAHLRQRVGAGITFQTTAYPIYPFLLTELESAPAPAGPSALPAAQHFDTMGQIFMRSGNGPDDTYALFAVAGKAMQHRHYDQGHFTIYHRGFLALDTGSRVNKMPSLQNYYAQTVAHNAVLIRMPNEEPAPYWNGTVEMQDGGQFAIDNSKLLAYKATDQLTYVAADTTGNYRPPKCAQMVRQFVFLPPHHFLVFDRVTSVLASQGKRWVLHHANEPKISGRTWSSDQGKGRLYCQTLLPADATIDTIGGPGFEFFVGPKGEGGKNYPVYTDGTPVPEMMGRWRVQVRPGAARQQDAFLHLIEVGDLSLAAISPAKLTDASSSARVVVTAGDREVTASFNKTGAVGAQITICRNGTVIADEKL